MGGKAELETGSRHAAQLPAGAAEGIAFLLASCGARREHADQDYILFKVNYKRQLASFRKSGSQVTV